MVVRPVMSPMQRIILTYTTVGVCLITLFVFSLLGVTSGKMAIVGIVVALLAATGAFLGVHAAVGDNGHDKPKQ